MRERVGGLNFSSATSIEPRRINLQRPELEVVHGCGFDLGQYPRKQGGC